MSGIARARTRARTRTHYP